MTTSRWFGFGHDYRVCGASRLVNASLNFALVGLCWDRQFSIVRRLRTMKRFVPSGVWFCAGIILSPFAGSVLFRLWSKLGILIPVAQWLGSLGGDTMAKGWFFIWVFIPYWICAAAVGILAGLFVKRHLVTHLLSFSIGFVLEPLATYVYSASDIPRFCSVVLYGVSVPLAVLCGVLSHRRRSPRTIALGPLR